GCEVDAEDDGEHCPNQERQPVPVDQGVQAKDDEKRHAEICRHSHVSCSLDIPARARLPCEWSEWGGPDPVAGGHSGARAAAVPNPSYQDKRRSRSQRARADPLSIEAQQNGAGNVESLNRDSIPGPSRRFLCGGSPCSSLPC